MAITCMLRSEIAKRMSTGKLFGITYWNCPWSIILSGNYNMYLNSLEFGKIIHSTVMSTLDIENRKSQGGRFITGKFRNVIVVLEISCVDYTFLHYTVMWHVFFYTSVPSTIVSGPLDPPLLTTGDTILRLWHQVCYIITSFVHLVHLFNVTSICFWQLNAIRLGPHAVKPFCSV